MAVCLLLNMISCALGVLFCCEFLLILPAINMIPVLTVIISYSVFHGIQVSLNACTETLYKTAHVFTVIARTEVVELQRTETRLDAKFSLTSFLAGF